MLNICQLNLNPKRRVIIISDIHASLALFKSLLEKINYTEDDYLFINGDLCEKGMRSLEVVRYVKRMTEQSKDVFVTKGNCDILYRYVLSGNEGILPYMKKHRQSILNEMLNEQDKSLEDFDDISKVAQFYKENYKEEIEWMESLPIAYETEHFILVHAGIENRPDWQETEEAIALSIDSFLDKGHQVKKNIIVGHWPAVNYRFQMESSNNPYIDREKRIIAIDGGNQIKRDGQLNALIFQDNQFLYESVDEIEEERIVKKDYLDQTKRVGTVTWPNYEMHVIERELYFTLCENVKLGYKQWIKNEYLAERDGSLYCKDDLSTTFLSVKKDEMVKVLDAAQSGYTLVKKGDGLVGWIPSELI